MASVGPSNSHAVAAHGNRRKTVVETIHERQFSIILAVSEVFFLILYGVFMVYDEQAMPQSLVSHHGANNTTNGANNTTSAANTTEGASGNTLMRVYPMFQDIHAMIFIGFGFLMTFLKRYAYTGVGFNLLLASYAIQWTGLMRGFLIMGHEGTTHVEMEVTQLVYSDFGAAAVLISMGAVLGTLSPSQYVIMTFIEVIFYSINEFVCYEKFLVSDIGGSTIIHTFGAYFGLALSRVLYTYSSAHSANEKASYFDDLFSMIGTIFLWIFWPSFNAALAGIDEPAIAHRTVLNTYISLAACCVVAFIMSSAVGDEAKLDMPHIQNATLAGGVAIGCTANLLITPVGAMVIGCSAGVVSVLGFKYLLPILRDKLKIHDTCGVHNLHGMPGVLGGITGIIVSLCLNDKDYGKDLFVVVEGRATRSHYIQAGYQTAGLVTTLAFAIVGGTFTGFILKLPFWQKLKTHEYFEDSAAWEVASALPDKDIDRDIRRKVSFNRTE